MSKIFPEEVDDLIIDQFHEDKKSLLKCSLVSSQWLTRSRHWLFNDLSLFIADSGYKEHDPRLISFIGSPTSTLAHWVRSLEIIGPGIRKERQEDQYRELNGVLQGILPRLEHVQVLDMKYITWNLLEPENQASIQGMQSLTSLLWDRAMVFDSFGQLVTISSNFLDLRTVKIGLGVRYAQKTDMAVDASVPMVEVPFFPRLQSLDLHLSDFTSPLIVISPSQSIHAGQIHTLRLKVDEALTAPVNMIGDFITAAGPSLTSLTLARSEELEWFPVSLSENVNLANLKIETAVKFDDMPWITKMVETIRSSSIVDISMKLHYEEFYKFDFSHFQSSILRMDPLIRPFVGIGFTLITPEWTRAVHLSLADLAACGKLFVNTNPGREISW